MEKYPQATYENFYKAVRADFIEFNKRLPEQEVDRYLKTEEEKIQRDFAMHSRRLKNNEIEEKVFWIGCVSAVANCLSLMYEPEETEETEEIEDEDPKLEKNDKLF